MNLLSALILLVHDLATVVLIGHYLLLSVIYLPVIQKAFSTEDGSSLFTNIIRGGQIWIYKSLLAFLITGVALMLTNENYMGVGQFVNSWSWLMVVKHVIVIGMVTLVFWIKSLTNFAAVMRLARASWLPKFTLNPAMMVRVQAGLGVVVLVLTALARV